jgi:3-hydroxyacyl-CoA dehydrogenase
MANALSGHGIRNVTVLGTGVLGAQIAFQTAYRGFAVTSYDVDTAALGAGRRRLVGLATTYREQVPGAAEGSVDETPDRVRLTCDLADAVRDADLVIEAVPEVLEVKRDVYTQLGPLAPERTIFATNSSTLLPSDLKDSTGRPDRFLALHFANRIWRFNTAEVMGTPETDPVVFDRVVEFATAIGMVSVPVRKEKAGYVLNSLLVPFLDAAAELAAFGYAEPHDVDNVWRIATGSPLGPFQVYDIIGLRTPYNVMMGGDDRTRRIAAWLKENYLDRGRLGVESGEGFYRYPAAGDTPDAGGVGAR